MANVRRAMVLKYVNWIDGKLYRVVFGDWQYMARYLINEYVDIDRIVDIRDVSVHI